MKLRIINLRRFLKALVLGILVFSYTVPAQAAFITSSVNGSSQWVDSGSSIYYNLGNVGIGSTPQAGMKLDIRSDAGDGNSAITAYGYNGNGGMGVRGYGYALTGTGNNYGIFGVSEGGRVAGVNIGGYFSASGAPSNYSLVTGEGNVGFGTLAPAAALDIQRNYGNDVGLKLSQPGSAIWLIKNIATSGDFSVGVGGADYLSILKASGNVGIGLTNPSVKLDILGNFRNTTATTHSLLGGSGNVVVMADNTGALYTSSAASSLLWSGSTSGNIWSANTGGVGIGTTAPGKKLEISTANGTESSLRIRQLSQNYWDFKIPASATRLTVGDVAGDYLTILNLGNVGIGTTNPEKMLHLRGEPNFKQTITRVSGGFAFNMNELEIDNANGKVTLFKQGVFGSADTPSVEYFFMGADSNTAYDNNTFRLYPGKISNFQGNVGIGTIAPTQKLVISGNALIDSGNMLYFRDTTTYINEGSGLNIVAGNTRSLNLAGGTGTDLTISSGGSVGIGTTAPTQKLDVNGTINFAGDLRQYSYIIFGASGNTAEYNHNSYYTSLGLFTNNLERVRIDSSGNVGIGLTNPGAALDVSGALRNSLATTHSSLGGSGNVLVMADNSGSLYTASASSFNSLWGGTKDGNIWNGTAGAGNVGIGTTNPGHKLDVNGNIQTNGSLIFSGSNPLINMSANAWGDKWYFAGSGIKMAMDQPSTSWLTTFGGATGLTRFRWSITKSGSINGPVLDLNSDGSSIFYGNVGIGTTNPNNKLSIMGVAATDATPSPVNLRLQAYYNTGTSQHGIGFYVNDSSYLGSGIFAPPGALSFFTSSNWSDVDATEKMRIDTSGNVGVGLTNPSTKLEVSGTVKATAFVGSGSGLTDITATNATNAVNSTYAVNATNATNAFRINYDNTASLSGQVQFMQLSEQNAAGDNPMAPGSWASIIKMNHGNGDTYFNRTLAFDFFTDDIYTRRRDNGTAYPWSKVVLSDLSNNVNLGTGVITAASFQYSDRNLKKNIQTISNPLDKISQLRGVTFNWKEDGKSSVGVIAQEVEKVYPELVRTNEDGVKTVQYGSLVAPLIEAVKEQQKKINNLEARIIILEKKK